MEEPRPAGRRAWYTALLCTTPCTSEYSEMSSMLTQLSSSAVAEASYVRDVGRS